MNTKLSICLFVCACLAYVSALPAEQPVEVEHVEPEAVEQDLQPDESNWVVYRKGWGGHTGWGGYGHGYGSGYGYGGGWGHGYGGGYGRGYGLWGRSGWGWH